MGRITPFLHDLRQEGIVRAKVQIKPDVDDFVRKSGVYIKAINNDKGVGDGDDVGGVHGGVGDGDGGDGDGDGDGGVNGGGDDGGNNNNDVNATEMI